MILADLPYGKTHCDFDILIPLKSLWKEYKRIIKDDGVIALTAIQPFASLLIMNDLKMFRYDLVWDKINMYTGALNANRMPLRRHEHVLIFYKKLPTYNKQYRKGKPFKRVNTKGHGEHTQYGRINKKDIQ